jgi:hypothetical protein
MGGHQVNDFDTLIFPPFGRYPQLFLPQATVNSAGLGILQVPWVTTEYMNLLQDTPERLYFTDPQVRHAA